MLWILVYHYGRPAIGILKIEEIPTLISIDKKSQVFDKTSAQMNKLVYKAWLSCYPWLRYIIYNDSSKFKVQFATPCNQFCIECKPTIKYPQENIRLECLHGVLVMSYI